MMMQQSKAAAAPARGASMPARSRPARRSAVVVVARSTKTATTKSVEKKKTSFLSQTISALDFAEVRSQSDAELLYEAKYGERGPDGKMTPAQAAALRRKVGGTAKDYWKTWIEADVTEAYMKPTATTQVPYLPILIGVVVSLLGATVFVVSQTA
jgi:hypothetical protein